MNRRTRLFMLVAMGILVLGLGTGLVASYFGLQNLVIIGADGPEELAYVSKDADWVAFASVREVMSSELRERLRQFQPGNDGAERFKAQTGIDIETDVDQVVASASRDAAGPPERALLLVRGRFDEARIAALVQEHGGTSEDYRGRTVFSAPEGNVAVGFLEPGLVAVGTPASVRGAVDTKESGGDVRDNAELMTLVRDVDDGNAWAVAQFDAVAGGPMPQELASRLPPINWVAARGVINGGVRGTLQAQVRDEAAADNLRDVIRGFVALARLQAGQSADFANLLDSLQLSGQGNTVSLDFAVPPEVIDALGALRAQRPRTPVPPSVP